jgi:hypothetical protein
MITERLITVPLAKSFASFAKLPKNVTLSARKLYSIRDIVCSFPSSKSTVPRVTARALVRVLKPEVAEKRK